MYIFLETVGSAGRCVPCGTPHFNLLPPSTTRISCFFALQGRNGSFWRRFLPHRNTFRRGPRRRDNFCSFVIHSSIFFCEIMLLQSEPSRRNCLARCRTNCHSCAVDANNFCKSNGRFREQKLPVNRMNTSQMPWFGDESIEATGF